jgi:hypothetical protein
MKALIAIVPTASCHRIIAGLLLLFAFASVIDAQSPPPQQAPAPSPFPTWHDEISKGYLPYHQLKVEEFKINDEAHPKLAYWLQPFVHPYCHYELKMAANGFVYAYITDWVVFSGFDKNLSVRNSRFRDMKTFLPSIQALFDIVEWHARKFAALKPGELPSGEGKTFEEARFQLDDKLRAFYQTKSWDAQKETDEFVKATDQGRDQKKVKALAEKIKQRLVEMPSANPPPK